MRCILSHQTVCFIVDPELVQGSRSSGNTVYLVILANVLTLLEKIQTAWCLYEFSRASPKHTRYPSIITNKVVLRTLR